MKLTDFNLINASSYDAPHGNVILIGLLEDGPAGQPFTLNESKIPSDYLGENPTTQTARQLISAGINPSNIIYYRLNGVNARYEYIEDDILIFDIVAVTAHSKQNNVQVTFSQEGLSIHTNYLSDNYIRTYRFDDYPFTSDLANAINSDAVLGLVDVIARNHTHSETKNLFTTGTYLLESGSEEVHLINSPVWDEENKQYYFNLFQQHILGKDFDGHSVSNLIPIQAEVLLFPDISIDEFPSIGEFASYIAQQKTDNQKLMVYSIFKTSPIPKNDLNLSENYLDGSDFLIREAPILPPNTEYTDEKVINPEDLYDPYQRQEAYTQRLLSLYDSDEQTRENFKHLIIVVGNESLENISPAGGDTPLAISILASDSSSNLSNKEISNFHLENVLTPSMFAKLAAKGYTYIVPSIRKKFVFQKVQSMYLNSNETILSNWSNQRTFSDFSYQLDVLFEPYIGKPISYMLPVTLRREIEELIQSFVAKGRIQSGFVNNIEFFSLDHSVDIEIELSFYQEINKIQGNIEIKKNGWDIDIWNLTN